MARSTEHEKAAGTIWERLSRTPDGPRVALSHELIARAAIEIADADGLDGVSMRKLADRLGVATMAPYRYVSGKSDLFELMLDACHGEIELAQEPASGWRAMLASYAAQVRELSLRHPWLILVHARLPGVLTPHMAAIVEQVLAAMDELDVDVDAKMAMVATVTAFVHGATAAEVAQRQLMTQHDWTSDDDVRAAYHPYVEALTSSGRFPKLTEYLVTGSNEDDGAWQFEFGLTCVLDGIAARLG